MKSLWDDREAAQYGGALGQRVYTSRLLGRDPSLVLHGGGNTSVKLRVTNRLGVQEDILYVKGSGWDLATIEPGGFSPVRLQHLLGLATLDVLSDADMANELKSNMIVASAPMPSVEAILHAIVPYPYVDHTHADALIAVMNSPHGEDRIREIYGDSVMIVPYVMPGFQLARLCAKMVPEHVRAQMVGIMLMNHGVFSFGQTARESYESMIDLVTRAEHYLERHGAWHLAVPSPAAPPACSRIEIAELRREVSSAAGASMIVSRHADAQALGFVRRDDLATLARQGPATPDHVLRTKRLPLIGRDVAAYRQEYTQYFATYAARSAQPLVMLDPAPRVILDPELGMCLVGRRVKDTIIAGDIYRHTMDIILRATTLGGYQALSAQDNFDVEYWDLEQAKLRTASAPRPFAGEVALVTGAASGIGKACVASLLARGAAVIGLDINPAITEAFGRPDALGVHCDVTDEKAVQEALDAGVDQYGGLDMLVLNAGIFPASRPIGSVTLAEWERIMRVNVDANLILMREAHPLLKLAPRGGRVAVIGSKNVPAPGPGAVAYSASKAALTQMARVAALEWGPDGIRVNVLHPNGVFDTGIWTDDVLQGRARSYGMSVEQYKTNNVLHVNVTSHDVAELAAELCGPLFARTTGAQIAVDGGNDRVI